MKELFEFRVLNKLSQSYIAEQLGISQAMLSYYENGKRKPSKEKIEQIHRLLEANREH